MDSKVCIACGVDKALDEFSVAPRGIKGRQARCKPCRAVYIRELRKGRSLHDEAKLPEAVSRRFYANVDKGDGNGCWLWTAARDTRNYGCFFFRGRLHAAHRVAWILEYGEMENGMMACHHCDNPPCVRPDHIFPGTNQDNHDDMVAKGRSIKGRTMGNRGVVGERHGRHKLQLEQVVEIHRLRREEHLQQWLIAERFGISRTAVSLIVNGHVWGEAIALSEASNVDGEATNTIPHARNTSE